MPNTEVNPVWIQVVEIDCWKIAGLWTVLWWSGATASRIKKNFVHSMQIFSVCVRVRVVSTIRRDIYHFNVKTCRLDCSMDYSWMFVLVEHTNKCFLFSFDQGHVSGAIIRTIFSSPLSQSESVDKKSYSKYISSTVICDIEYWLSPGTEFVSERHRVIVGQITQGCFAISMMFLALLGYLTADWRIAGKISSLLALPFILAFLKWVMFTYRT